MTLLIAAALLASPTAAPPFTCKFEKNSICLAKGLYTGTVERAAGRIAWVISPTFNENLKVNIKVTGKCVIEKIDRVSIVQLHINSYQADEKKFYWDIGGDKKCRVELGFKYRNTEEKDILTDIAASILYLRDVDGRLRKIEMKVGE